MNKSYLVQKTTNGLLIVEPTGDAHHNNHPKESLIDAAERAYLKLKREHGTNFVVSAKALQQQMGCPESTFNDNFCGGINGFLSLAERIVLDRFTEAVADADEDITSALNAGFRALIRVNPRSRFNVYHKTEFDMNQRSRFAAETFPPEYWQAVLAPLIPAINAFLMDNISTWTELPEEMKAWMYRLAAGMLREVTLLLTKEDLSRYRGLEQAKLLQDYITLFKKLVLGNARLLYDDRYESVTEIMRIMERIGDIAKTN